MSSIMNVDNEAAQAMGANVSHHDADAISGPDGLNPTLIEVSDVVHDSVTNIAAAACSSLETEVYEQAPIPGQGINTNSTINNELSELATTSSNQVGTAVSPTDSQDTTVPLGSSPLSPLTDPGDLLALEHDFEAEHSNPTIIKRQRTDDDGEDGGPIPKSAKQFESYQILEVVQFDPSTVSAMPEAWSDKRGGICETLPDYAQYQASLHSNDRIAKGFLIDGEVDPRDVLSAQVVICSVGGGREKDGVSRQNIRVKSSELHKMPAMGLLKAHERQMPVLLIAGMKQPLTRYYLLEDIDIISSTGNGHPQYPKGVAYRYGVLGYFHVSHCWMEIHNNKPDNPVNVLRIRFEKVDLATPSWWDLEGKHIKVTTITREVPSTLPGASGPSTPLIKECQRCNKDSTEMFTVGWFCQNHTCGAYYEGLGEEALRTLTYTTAFIDMRTPFTSQVPPVLARPVPDFFSAHGTESASRTGFRCPECGCCNRRIFWDYLICENPACQCTWPAPKLPYPTANLGKDIAKLGRIINCTRNRNSLTNDQGSPDFNLAATRHQIFKFYNSFTAGNYMAWQYLLPGPDGAIIGSFTLFEANDAITEALNGPTDMFRELEPLELGLKRNSASRAKDSQERLTRHFQQNFGARYKFGVEVQSKGFDEAPPVIMRALHRLVWASRQAIANTQLLVDKAKTPATGTPTAVADLPTTMTNDFNELLALGFMEGDAIGYHDDGESELGPTVAALSLGSPSIMKFRPKRKFLQYTDLGLAPPSPGPKGRYQDVLKVPMKHGDIMVMHGTAIHRYYEHAVDPVGERRFSLTSRYIDPTKMKVDADKADAAVKGAMPRGSQAYAYGQAQIAQETQNRPVPRDVLPVAMATTAALTLPVASAATLTAPAATTALVAASLSAAAAPGSALHPALAAQTGQPGSGRVLRSATRKAAEAAKN
ncbi:hypothetical protein OQA88_4972 [Cercophora sp. LCS_1]